jgi:hypothetical protein
MAARPLNATVPVNAPDEFPAPTSWELRESDEYGEGSSRHAHGPARPGANATVPLRS